MKIISHPANKGFESKLLSEHLLNVATASKGVIDSLNLDIRLIDQNSLAHLAFIIGLLHDIGKASSFFQAMITERSGKDALTHHSLASAVITYSNITQMDFPEWVAPIVFKLIQRHHGNLDSLERVESIDHGTILQTRDIILNVSKQYKVASDLCDIIDKNRLTIRPLDKVEIKQILEDVSEYQTDLDIEDGFELFLLSNLLFSSLVSCDKLDAARMSEFLCREVRSLNYNPVQYMKATIGDTEANKINALRESFFQKVGKNPGIRKDQYLYTITAPTGIGKTFACMNFVNSLQNMLDHQQRVIYCLPYTSIIDQNFDIYRKILQFNNPCMVSEEYKYIIKHHHLQDYYRLTNNDQDYDYWNYLNDLLFVGTWNSSLVVSTFVQLFHSLIGNRNSMLLKLNNLINSIVVLDEIQSISPHYYLLLKVLFKVLAQRFKTYIVLSTATAPVLMDENSSVELSDTSLFLEDIFDRVSFHYVKEPIKIVDLIDDVKYRTFNNLLVVLNTKKAVTQAYLMLKKEFSPEYKVFCLSTNQIPLHRNRLIENVHRLLSNGTKLILVTTQLIEAGVDISFELTYRDFAPLDSVIQTAGRCNRNGEYGHRGGTLYLRHFTDDNNKEYAPIIYDKYLLQQTKLALQNNEAKSSRDFLNLTKKYFSSLDCEGLSRGFINSIISLNYDLVKPKSVPIAEFKLITDNYATQVLYISTDASVEQDIEALIKIREDFYSSSPDQKTKEDLKLRLIQLDNCLKKNRLNLSKGNIAQHIHDNPYFRKISDYEYYIPHAFLSSTYNEETGFSQDILDQYQLGQF